MEFWRFPSLSILCFVVVSPGFSERREGKEAVLDFFLQSSSSVCPSYLDGISVLNISVLLWILLRLRLTGHYVIINSHICVKWINVFIRRGPNGLDSTGEKYQEAWKWTMLALLTLAKTMSLLLCGTREVMKLQSRQIRACILCDRRGGWISKCSSSFQQMKTTRFTQGSAQETIKRQFISAEHR